VAWGLVSEGNQRSETLNRCGANVNSGWVGAKTSLTHRPATLPHTHAHTQTDTRTHTDRETERQRETVTHRHTAHHNGSHVFVHLSTCRDECRCPPTARHGGGFTCWFTAERAATRVVWRRDPSCAGPLRAGRSSSAVRRRRSRRSRRRVAVENVVVPAPAQLAAHQHAHAAPHLVRHGCRARHGLGGPWFRPPPRRL
jgi:hypothetical protein